MRPAPQIVLLLCIATGPLHAQTALSPQELHDRLVVLIHKNATRPIPAGDTLVTWSPIPNLYSTVRRTPDSVVSSLVRADAMVGTAETAWRSGSPVYASVLWTQGDSTLLGVTYRQIPGALAVTGSRVDTLALPHVPWAIADYGMEDQLLPLFVRLSHTTTVAVYRPFPAKWDTLAVASERHGSAILITVRDITGDSEEWRWVVGPSGALLRIIRSKYPDFERRPLPESQLVPAYREYGPLAGQF